MSEIFGGFIHEPSDAAASGLTKAEEVILTFQENVSAGTAINIQTGAYAGQVTPPTIEGTLTLTLPATFNTDAEIQVILNGNELKKPEDVLRTSITQVTLNEKLKTGYILKVRIFT